MEDKQSILHELYVYSEWKPEPDYLQKSDSLLPDHISALWRWVKFFGPKKSLIDGITVHKERQQKWHIALGDEGKVIAVLTDNILEIRTKRSDYATIAARTTVSRDAYPQWRKVVWSPDCSFVTVAYGNGVVSFFDLTATNLFNIPIECSRPGGLECTDNTHAVADIIFIPLRVKDIKWNWEVLIVTYDGKLRGYLVSQTDGYKLHHRFEFTGGVGAVAYSAAHSLLYVAGLPRGVKDPNSSLYAGITAWRILNDDPFYKLSVVSDQLEAEFANQRYQIYLPFVSSKNLAFIVHMEVSTDGSKLVCVHCTGEVSIWRLPLLTPLHRHPLQCQPAHDMKNPLDEDSVEKKDTLEYCPADVNWWSDQEIILSRFNGSVSVSDVSDLVNRLGKRPEFFRGAPRVTRAHGGTFLALECEANVMPANKPSEDSMEVVKADVDIEDGLLGVGKEMLKSLLYAITDMEAFQPRPRRITVVSRVYRLLAIRSTTPDELFARKIESGKYEEALSLASTYDLDSDLVYQQQWRKATVSANAICQYLSKVSKKIWTVHQCVDRLPETLPAAKDLLRFGLELTNLEIMTEINKDRIEDVITNPEDITLDVLNSYSSELLRCRHVMLFYKERLKLYEAILRCEKSTYVKEEYDRLRSNSLVHSAIELAKEGRIAALTCLWLHMKSVTMRMTVLEKLPETINPFEYKHLLPNTVVQKDECAEETAVKDRDWCRKQIFRSIWNTTWSEEVSIEKETLKQKELNRNITAWYENKARQIEEHSGLVSHALTLVTLAKQEMNVTGLDEIMFHLVTLDTLVYDIGLEDVGLKDIEKLSPLETCHYLMKKTTLSTFVSDIKDYVVPFLRRHNVLIGSSGGDCVHGLTEYLVSVSVDDLSFILTVLQSEKYEVEASTRLHLAQRCLLAHTGCSQLHMAKDIVDALPTETDGSISPQDLSSSIELLKRLVDAASVLWRRSVDLSLNELKNAAQDVTAARNTLMRLARSMAFRDNTPPDDKNKKVKPKNKRNKNGRDDKPSQQDWEKLLKDLLDLQKNFFVCMTEEQCHEIYASALLTSGDSASIKLAAEVLTCDESDSTHRNLHLVPYARSVSLVTNAAREYFNSASSLKDPALELARCCLLLVNDDSSHIQDELNLIDALSILSQFNLTILPIQVRLCDNRMSLIEECLKLDPASFLASHKLLKLAKLLRICGDDEQKREGEVLQLVCAHALSGGCSEPGAMSAAVAAARRLYALRHCYGAELMAIVAEQAQTHADRNTRRELFAAAATYCSPDSIEEILRSRLTLEMEGLHQSMAVFKKRIQMSDQWPSTDDEYSDAVTTPLVDRRIILMDTRVPILTQLLETWQSTFSESYSDKSEEAGKVDRSVHVPEFYRSLYPNYKSGQQYYQYSGFSLPHSLDEDNQALILNSCYYIEHCADQGYDVRRQGEVVQKLAEELLYKDTPLAVCSIMHTLETMDPRSVYGMPLFENTLLKQNTPVGISALLYATIMGCNAPDMRDNVYLTTPLQLARSALTQDEVIPEYLELIRACLDKLNNLLEVEKLREYGFSVNGLMFNSDQDYRKEVLYRVAGSGNKNHLDFAWTLAAKYGVSVVELWVAHAAAIIKDVSSVKRLCAEEMLTSPADKVAATDMLKDRLWDEIDGADHSTLIQFFSLMSSLTDKLMWGLTPTEHIKLLKKAKSACQALNYKLLLQQPSSEEYLDHVLSVISPENVGLLSKFLRTLPPAFKTPVTVNTIYTTWLIKYFFSVSSSNATNKKWMHHYRQCVSYFNKLTQDDMMHFIRSTCFSDDAIDRVPGSTRSLMVMQAVDYCQQEPQHLKTNKNELTWKQVGLELSKWGRYLENFHSSVVQAIVDKVRHKDAPDELWKEIEKGQGNLTTLKPLLRRLLLEREIQSGPLLSLLQCLNLDTNIEEIFADVLSNVAELSQVETLVSKVIQYHKEGVKFTESLLEGVMKKASELGVPLHKQVGILALSQRTMVQDEGDMEKVAEFSIDLFRTEWSDHEFVVNMTNDQLLSEEGRRATFTKLLELSTTWQRKKALVDALNCWPTGTYHGVKIRIHCEYIKSLLEAPDQKESVVLIKMLLKKPVLVEEEIKWLSDSVPSDAVLSLVWVILLSECKQSMDTIPALLNAHKTAILEKLKSDDIEDELIVKLLEEQLFIKLVSTPLYGAIVKYVQRADESTTFNVPWAIEELTKANFLAEAGHLQLVSIGVPRPLLGFTQSILFAKKSYF